MFCTIHRWLISRGADSQTALPRFVSTHLARCPACRRFGEQCMAMGERLPAEASHGSAEVSPQLHAAILRRCVGVSPAGYAAPAAGPSRSRLRTAAALVAAAAVIVAAAVAAYHLRPQPEPSAPVRIVEGDSETLNWLIDPGSLTAGPAAMIEQALRDSVDEEIDLLARDGEAAAEFLLACLPLDLRAPPGRPASTQSTHR